MQPVSAASSAPVVREHASIEHHRDAQPSAPIFDGRSDSIKRAVSSEDKKALGIYDAASVKNESPEYLRAAVAKEKPGDYSFVALGIYKATHPK